MKLKDRINRRLTDSSDWILNSPEALVTLMLMGTGLGSIIFTGLAIGFLIARAYFPAILFGFFSYGAIHKLVSIIKSIKTLGYKDAFGGFTAMEFVWKKDKHGRRLDENGLNGCGTEESNEGEPGTDKTAGRGLRSDNKEPERTNTWTNFMLQRSDSVMQESGDDRRRNSKTDN